MIARLALNKKAEELKILDMRPVSNFCDFFIILTASSGRRAQAIVDHIREGLDKKRIPLKAQEGKEDSGWILLDLFDVVVHIFNSQARLFYNLDKLWADAPEIEFPPNSCAVRRQQISAGTIASHRVKKNVIKPVRRPAQSAARKGTA